MPTNTPNPGPTPEELRAQEAERLRQEKLDKKLHRDPRAQELFNETRDKLHERLTTPRLNLDDGFYFKALEDQLWANFPEFPRPLLEKGLKEALLRIMNPSGALAINAATPIGDLLRDYVFHQPGMTPSPEVVVKRLRFLQEYFIRNVYCIYVQEGHEEEAKKAASAMFLQRKLNSGAYREGFGTASKKEEKDKATYDSVAEILTPDLTDGIAADVPFYPEEPILIIQTTPDKVDSSLRPSNLSKDTSDVRVPFIINNYRLNDSAVQQLYARQFIEQIAHAPGVREYLGLSVDKLLDGNITLPLEVMEVALNEDDPDADTKNATLGLTDDTLAYYKELKRAHKQVQTWLDPETPEGVKRRAYLQEYLTTKQIRVMSDLNLFAQTDAELGNAVTSILAGEEKYRNIAKRNELRRLQPRLRELLEQTAVPESLRTRTDTHDIIVKDAGDPVAHDAFLELVDALYDEGVQKLPRLVMAGIADPRMAAVEKLAWLDLENEHIPEDVTEDDLENVKLFYEETVVSRQSVEQLIDKTGEGLDEHKAKLRGALKNEVLQGDMVSGVMKVLALYDDAAAVGFDFNALLYSQRKELRDLDIWNNTLWESDPAYFRHIMQHLMQFRQYSILLDDIHSHFGKRGTEPRSLLAGGDVLDMDKVCDYEDGKFFDSVIANYDNTSNLTRDDWQIHAVKEMLQSKIDEVQKRIDDAGENPVADDLQKRHELLCLQKQIEGGQLTLEDLHHLDGLADPELVPDDDTKGALQRLVNRGIVSTAEQHANMELEDMDAIDPAEMNAIYGNLAEGDNASLHEHISHSPREEVINFLEGILSKRITFKSTEKAQDEMNRVYRLAMQASNGVAPEMPKMRIGADAWYKINSMQVTNPKRKKGEPEQTKPVDFFACITDANASGVRLNGRVGRLSLEEFVFHVVNAAFEPSSKFKITWVHDNTTDPVTTVEELEAANVGLGRDNLGAGSVLELGGERWGEVIEPGFYNHQYGVWIQYDKKIATEKGKKPGKALDFVTYTELYLMKKFADSKTIFNAQGYDPRRPAEEGYEDPFRLRSIAGLWIVGKSIFNYKKNQVEKWGKMRKTLEALYWFRHDGKNIWNKGSLWVAQQNEMEHMENDIAKSYKTKLENLQHDQLEEKILKEMQRFDKLDLNQVSSGNSMSDLLGETPIFVHRAEFKTLMLFVLEHFGNLYPFEHLAPYRQRQYWLNKISGNKDENQRGFDFALKNKGPSDGLAEVYQVAGIARARINLYGDTYAQQIESAYTKGQSAAKSAKQAELDLKQTGGQIKAQLILALKNRDWAGIEVIFGKLAQKMLEPREMFNFFLFMYTEITKYEGGKHALPPHIPYEELKNLAGAVFPKAPELYFFLAKGEGNVRLLDNFLLQADSNVFKYEWDEDSMTPKFKGKVAEIYKAFTLTGGDYRMLEGYAAAMNSKPPAYDNNYVSSIQKTEIPSLDLNLGDHDPHMWDRSPLLRFNRFTLEHLVARHMTPSGLDNEHSKNYMESLLKNIEELYNSSLNAVDKKAFMDMIRRAFYSQIYNKFDFKDDTARYSSEDPRYKELRGKISDRYPEKAGQRDSFMKTYYAWLRKIGLSVQECAVASDSDAQFLEYGDPKAELFREKTRKEYLVWNVSNESTSNNVEDAFNYAQV